MILRTHGDGSISLVKGALNNFWAFGDKNPFFRFIIMEELCLRKTCIDIQLRGGKICDRDNI